MDFFENKFLQIFIACVIPGLGAWIFSWGTSDGINIWYQNLLKPDWSPPIWTYGPIWFVLFVTMGYASYRVWAKEGFSGAAKLPLIIYVSSLLINWTLPQVLFNFHLIGFSAIHSLVLLILVSITGILFNRIDKIAGILYIPHVAWMAFGSFLCFNIWRLNS